MQPRQRRKAEFDLLRSHVEVAKATMRQKISLLAARDAKAKDLTLLEADLQRAHAGLTKRLPS